MSTGTPQQARVMIELLKSSPANSEVAVLVDGDQGGANILKRLGPALEAHKILSKKLVSGTSIEDHLPLLRELFPQAVAHYLSK